MSADDEEDEKTSLLASSSAPSAPAPSGNTGQQDPRKWQDPLVCAIVLSLALVAFLDLASNFLILVIV